MTVHILGLGSIGILNAFLLRRTFPSLLVYFLPRPSTTPPTSFTLQYGDGQAQSIVLANDANGTSPIECLLVTTKAHHSRGALKPYIGRLTNTSLVTFIQNGMGVVDSIQDILPSQRIVLGTTTHAVYRSKAQQFHWVFEGDTYIAPQASTSLSSLEAAILSALGQLITFTELEKRLYRKLALNACINPVTAIYKVRNAEVARDGSPARGLSMRLAQEIQHLYAKLHPDLEVSNLSDDVIKLCIDTGANTSSMLADILSGKTTEIDFINGYIVKMGKLSGIEVSQNEMVIQKVKELTE